MARSTTGGGFFSSAVRLAIVFLALIFLSPGVVHAVVVDATWVYDRTPANDDLARFTILDTLYIYGQVRGRPVGDLSPATLCRCGRRSGAGCAGADVVGLGQVHAAFEGSAIRVSEQFCHKKLILPNAAVRISGAHGLLRLRGALRRSPAEGLGELRAIFFFLLLANRLCALP
jgi:hypothetical protein